MREDLIDGWQIANQRATFFCSIINWLDDKQFVKDKFEELIELFSIGAVLLCADDYACDSGDDASDEDNVITEYFYAPDYDYYDEHSSDDEVS